MASFSVKTAARRSNVTKTEISRSCALPAEPSWTIRNSWNDERGGDFLIIVGHFKDDARGYRTIPCCFCRKQVVPDPSSIPGLDIPKLDRKFQNIITMRISNNADAVVVCDSCLDKISHDAGTNPNFR
jgi:hypothetical protein